MQIKNSKRLKSGFVKVILTLSFAKSGITGRLPWWLNWLILRLQASAFHVSTGSCLHYSTIPFTSLFVGKQQRMAQCPGSLHSHEKPRRDYCLLTFDQLSSSHYNHLKIEPADRSYFSASPSLCRSPFLIKKIFFQKKKSAINYQPKATSSAYKIHLSLEKVFRWLLSFLLFKDFI